MGRISPSLCLIGVCACLVLLLACSWTARPPRPLTLARVREPFDTPSSSAGEAHRAKNTCPTARRTPITPRGCFNYTVAAADVARVDLVATDSPLSKRALLCEVLGQRFGTSPPYITAANDPSSPLPYCEVPRRITAETVSGTTNNAVHSNAAVGDRLRICPPQTFGKRCIYHTPAAGVAGDNTCESVRRTFGATGNTDVTVATVPASCPLNDTDRAAALIQNPNASINDATEPTQCNVGTASRRADRFLVCSTQTHKTTAAPASDGCDDAFGACQAACGASKTCRYFKYDGTEGLSSRAAAQCTLYSAYDKLTNIGTNDTESTVYGCRNASAFRSQGLMSLPSDAPGHTSVVETSLLDRIPCGDCTTLGSVGCDEGACLPPFESTEARYARGRTMAGQSVQVVPTTAECMATMRRALEIGGIQSLPSQGGQITRDEIVRQVCEG